MPTYDYLCSTCNKHTQLIRKITDISPAMCPTCAAQMQVVILSAPSVNLKNFNGWPDKASKFNREMLKRNEEAGKAQATSHKAAAMMPNLVDPTTNETIQLDSWKDAKKLAGEKGLDVNSYDQQIAKEEARNKK